MATQIRQNTRATRAETTLGLTNAWQDYLLHTAQPEVASLMLKSRSDIDSLSEEDLYRLYVIMRVAFRRYENDFMQSQSGTFDDAVWGGYRKSLIGDVLSTPVSRAIWKMQRGFFAPAFTEVVDEMVAGLEAKRDSDFTRFSEHLREMVRRERSKL